VNEPIRSGITDKAPKPPGLLPKNVQSWLILGLAVLMVVIMWLTGGKKSPATPKASALAPLSPATTDINETKIAELQDRIQQLQREELIAQNALAQQNRIPGAAASGSETNPSGSASGEAQPERAEDVIQAERKKRSYLSLFASNVALSFRKQGPLTSSAFGDDDGAQAATPETPPFSPKPSDLAQLWKEVQPAFPPSATISTAPVPSATASPAAPEPNKKELRPPAAASTGAATVAGGKTYVVFEGTILETVLINRLDGANAGPIECLVTSDIYSRDRQHLLVPAGSKVLGETRKVEAFGQTRLAVVFHRLLMPDGYSVSLDGFKGLNQTGDTALRDQVNNHYLRIFGASLAVGAIGAAAEAGTGGFLTQSGTDRLRQGFGQSTAQSSAQILDRFLNVLPTITIREGHRVKVYLSGDLTLPDYNHHNLPSDL
jgi:type IV secretory pathway VirB10-like protein